MLILLLNFLPTVLSKPIQALSAFALEHLGFIAKPVESFQTQRCQHQRLIYYGYPGLVQGVLGVVLVWLLTTPPVWAGESGLTAIEPSPQTPTQLDATDIPSEQVDQFVDIYLQVVALVDSRSGALNRATTESESLQIQQSIQAEAYQLIEAAGMTRLTYWQLLGLANSDAEFRDRILAQLEEKE